MGSVETKIKSHKTEVVARKMLGGLGSVAYLEHHPNGKVWVTWRHDYFQVSPKNETAQAL